MAQRPLDPSVADEAPHATALTGYDEQHAITYLRLLDAEAEGADWTEVARIVLHIDPTEEPARARKAWDSHLARAKWLVEQGYEHLLQGSPTLIRYCPKRALTTDERDPAPAPRDAGGTTPQSSNIA